VTLGLVVALIAAGCGGGKDTPPAALQAVVQAWSKALNAGDNEAAAELFAPGAHVVQAGYVRRLDTHRDAVEWNSGLPCSGRIVSMSVYEDTVEATFVLGPRGGGDCYGLGQRATAAFTIRDGKIVLWHQLPPPEPEAPTV
jgi:hypothetical protein